MSFWNAPYKNLNIVILLLLKALKQVHYNSNTPPSGGLDFASILPGFLFYIFEPKARASNVTLITPMSYISICLFHMSILKSVNVLCSCNKHQVFCDWWVIIYNIKYNKAYRYIYIYIVLFDDGSSISRLVNFSLWSYYVVDFLSDFLAFVGLMSLHFGLFWNRDMSVLEICFQ